MNAPGSYNSITLFTPPRLAEEGKAYWPGLSQFDQRAVATTGLGSLGQQNMWADFLAPIHSGFMDLVDTFTGAKGQREAQVNALRLAELQAQQSSYEAQQRSQGWSKATPWLAVGGALVVGAVILVAVRK